ncbi:unnamed protein product, partial [Choristocarpus tenellus]
MQDLKEQLLLQELWRDHTEKSTPPYTTSIAPPSSPEDPGTPISPTLTK